MKKEWYIVKKKTATRWTAYELKNKPALKRGYEAKGPFANLARCLVEANRDDATTPGGQGQGDKSKVR